MANNTRPSVEGGVQSNTLQQHNNREHQILEKLEKYTLTYIYIITYVCCIPFPLFSPGIETPTTFF